MLTELPRYLAATSASSLSVEDAVLLCEALLPALQDAGPLPPALLTSTSAAGVSSFYGAMQQVQGQLSAGQQLQVLQCVAAMSKAGCGKWLQPAFQTGLLARIVGTKARCVSKCNMPAVGNAVSPAAHLRACLAWMRFGGGKG